MPILRSNYYRKEGKMDRARERERERARERGREGERAQQRRWREHEERSGLASRLTRTWRHICGLY